MHASHRTHTCTHVHICTCAHMHTLCTLPTHTHMRTDTQANSQVLTRHIGVLTPPTGGADLSRILQLRVRVWVWDSGEFRAHARVYRRQASRVDGRFWYERPLGGMFFFVFFIFIFFYRRQASRVDGGGFGMNGLWAVCQRAERESARARA